MAIGPQSATGHAARPFALAVRRPGWAGDDGMSSGEWRAGRCADARPACDPAARAAVISASTRGCRRALCDGRAQHGRPANVIDLTIPKSLRLEPTDDRSVAAIMWGPLVLAGDLGPRRRARRTEGDAQSDAVALVAAGGRSSSGSCRRAERGNFRQRVARAISGPNDAPGDLSLTPFYRTQERTYSVYFDVLTPPVRSQGRTRRGRRGTPASTRGGDHCHCAARRHDR